MARRGNEVFYSKDYHPIQAGSIDGTDVAPHDHGIYRAMIAKATGLYDPTGDPKAQGDPFRTIFVGRLSPDTTEATLNEAMSKYGRIKSMRLVRHIVTGASRGYAFVEFESEKDFLYAYEAAHNTVVDGSQILVDYNRQQLMRGWIPRRLGGGLGGRKESGQLRFGGRDRPFRVPLRKDVPREELEKLGIPVSPERYYTRFQVPPPPRRKSRSPERRSRRNDERSERYNTESDEEPKSRKRSYDSRRDSKDDKRYYDETRDSYDRRRDSKDDKKHRHSSYEDDDQSYHNRRDEHKRKHKRSRSRHS